MRGLCAKFRSFILKFHRVPFPAMYCPQEVGSSLGPLGNTEGNLEKERWTPGVLLDQISVLSPWLID